MTKLNVIKNMIFWFLLAVAAVGCTIEPIRQDNVEGIKGAPDWVNKGSTMLMNKDVHRFIGVAFASPQGDMALQKSIADDKSVAEVGKLLALYLENISSANKTTPRSLESSIAEDIQYRAIEITATRDVKEHVAHKIDEAVARQFKEKLSAQFKEDIARQIKEAAARRIKDAISYQIEFMHELEDEVERQIKEAVSRQLRNTTKDHLIGSRLIASWRDPKTNVIWSASELDLSNVRKSMVDAKEVNADLKVYFDENAEFVFERMINDKHNISPFGFR